MRDVIVLPASAIQNGASGNFVYIVGKDSTVSMRDVTVGPSSGDRIAVLKGVNPGETVVSDGADRLRDGAQVIVPAAVKGSGLAGSATPPKESASGAGGAGGWAAGGDRQARMKRMLARLPADVRAKVEKMSPDERRSFMRQYRKEHGGFGGGNRNGGGSGGPP
jgi:multidrug efflux system membrane fusion protein